MDDHFAHSLSDRRSMTKSRTPPVRWFREWVPQDLVSTGGKCLVLKWVNGDLVICKQGTSNEIKEGNRKRGHTIDVDNSSEVENGRIIYTEGKTTLKAMKDKLKETEAVELEPEPTTEVLFLCSYEGCGKTFIDAGALRKHSHIHGERQYICHYENCGKKFLDSSKLKRHFLIHTGERDFVCPHEGCGKAFSLDFNLRSHMKTHSQENYHLCPYPECGKRYAHEYKLKNHIASHHEKNSIDVVKYTPPVEKPVKTSKSNTGASGPASSDRPYACPYEGCEKAYIHEYKLNLHLRREHPDHFPDDNDKNKAQANTEIEIDEGSDQEAYAGKRSNGKVLKQSRQKPSLKMPPSKVTQRKNSTSSSANMNVVKKPWSVKDEMYDEEDSEETEEERDNIVEGGWRYGENNDDDEEETEDED